jgi:hypothetical protein
MEFLEILFHVFHRSRISAESLEPTSELVLRSTTERKCGEEEGGATSPWVISAPTRVGSRQSHVGFDLFEYALCDIEIESSFPSATKDIGICLMDRINENLSEQRQDYCCIEPQVSI